MALPGIYSIPPLHLYRGGEDLRARTARLRPSGPYRRLLIGRPLSRPSPGYRRLPDSFVSRRTEGESERARANVNYRKKALVSPWEASIAAIRSASHNMNLVGGRAARKQALPLARRRPPAQDTFLLHVKGETLIVARELLQCRGLSSFLRACERKRHWQNVLQKVVIDILIWKLRRPPGRHERQSNEGERVAERS